MQPGIAHVGGTYTPGVPPLAGVSVMTGANEIATMGVRVIKVFLSDDYASDYSRDTWGSPTTLTELAQETPFSNLFSSANFDVYIIGTWTFANSINDPWRSGLTVSMLQNETNELQEFAEYLLTTYAGTGKTFIIGNWEADWAYLGTTDTTYKVPSYRAESYIGFTRARRKAITNARNNIGEDNVTIKFAFEVNRILDIIEGTRFKRTLRDIIPYIKPDIIDYSSYDSTTAYGSNQAEMLSVMTTNFNRAIKLIKHYAPGIPFFIGEIGWPEEELPIGYNIGDIYEHAWNIAESAGSEYFIYWQIWDNECTGTGIGCRGFWIQRPDETYNEVRDKILTHV